MDSDKDALVGYYGDASGVIENSGVGASESIDDVGDAVGDFFDSLW
jgi:hypothetical protein